MEVEGHRLVMDVLVRGRRVGQQPLKSETKGAGVCQGGSQGGKASRVKGKVRPAVPEGGAGLVGLSVGCRAGFH